VRLQRQISATFVQLVIVCGGTNHESLYRWKYGNDGVINSRRKAAKLPWTDSEMLSLDLKDEAPLQDDEAFITGLMRMRSMIGPGVRCMVVPDL
jgi:hypothetical protein